MTAFAPPRPIVSGLWPVIYGSKGIVLGYAETKEAAQKAADAFNKQAPQYDHRVGEPT